MHLQRTSAVRVSRPTVSVATKSQVRIHSVPHIFGTYNTVDQEIFIVKNISSVAYNDEN